MPIGINICSFVAIAGRRYTSVSPAGNRCHFVLLDKDESRPTADLSNTGRPNGPAYSTGELLNATQAWRKHKKSILLVHPLPSVLYCIAAELQCLHLHIISRH